jgi:NAD(P)H-nitrite reductase large subunit
LALQRLACRLPKLFCKRDPTAEVVILSDEPHLPYYRPLISYLIYGGKAENEILREARLTPPSLDLRVNARVTRLDPLKHTLTIGQGGELSYDRLLIACGASPIRPEIPGLDGPGVFGLRTWEDALGIAKRAAGTKNAVILGAGRIGMKASFALRHLGLEVTVVELLDRIVPQQLDAEAAAIFAGAVAEAGIRTILGHTLKSVNHKGEQITSVTLDDGRQLEAGLVIAGVGVRPNLALATASGLRCGRGLLVDEGMRTSQAHVFAAGDGGDQGYPLGANIVSGIWTSGGHGPYCGR